jgi:hypothetical protein
MSLVCELTTRALNARRTLTSQSTPLAMLRSCAWPRAASRLLSQGIDRLFAAGLFWLCQKGQEPPFPAVSTKKGLEAMPIKEGPVLGKVNKGGRFVGVSMSARSIYTVVVEYAERLGVDFRLTI